MRPPTCTKWRSHTSLAQAMRNTRSATGPGFRDQRSDVQTLSPTPDPRPPIPAYACHHNLAYWLNADYLACGAGAHGHVYPRRYADVLGIDDYISRIRAGQSPIAETTELTQHDL